MMHEDAPQVGEVFLAQGIYVEKLDSPGVEINFVDRFAHDDQFVGCRAADAKHGAVPREARLPGARAPLLRRAPG